MKVVQVKVNELEGFVMSELYSHLTELPITHLRALSQAYNPRADKDDVALLVAYEGTTLLSYIGILPDTICLHGTPEKMYWNSCWWANDKIASNGAMLLFYSALKLTGGKFHFPDLTPHTTQILGKMGKFRLDNHEGVKAYLVSNLAHILPKKKQAFSKISGVLRLADAMLNYYGRLHRRRRLTAPSSSAISYECVDEIDVELDEFIATQQASDLFKRGRVELNWIKQSPWITTHASQQETARRYAFSLYAEQFDNVFVKVWEQNRIVGFFALLLRNNEAKLTYCYYNTEFQRDAVYVLQKILIERQVHNILIFDGGIIATLKTNQHPFLHIRAQSRVSAHPLNVDFVEKHLQLGDGDCAFV